MPHFIVIEKDESIHVYERSTSQSLAKEYVTGDRKLKYCLHANTEVKVGDRKDPKSNVVSPITVLYAKDPITGSIYVAKISNVPAEYYTDMLSRSYPDLHAMRQDALCVVRLANWKVGKVGETE